MLFSCLMTANELEPCLSEYDAQLQPLWHAAVAGGCRINMVALEAVSRRHQPLFVQFCKAWTTALPHIYAEEGAMEAITYHPV